MKKVICILLAFIANQGFTQDKYTISGHMKDATNGEELIGSTVYIEELKTGTSANVFGFYSITLPAGTYHLKYAYIGYSTLEKTIQLTSDIRKDIELETSATALAAVEITSDQDNENVASTQMSVAKLNIKEIETIPVLFGEKDVLKTIQLLPGVSSAGEGSTGFNVRGGSSDQNLILLDGAPIYNASHLLGFFSVFNSDALKDLTLYKGGIPAQFGGRSSSVLDVYMKNGNSKKLSTSGGIGLISSRLTIEGPLIKDKSSFIVSGRRTYADLFVRGFGGEQFEDMQLYFWDLNAKANLTINQNNKIFLSGYFGEDNFGRSGLMGFSWGNNTGTLRWNHIFNDKLFMNTSAIYSKYNYKFEIERDGNNIEIGAGIEDVNFTSAFDYFINPKNKIQFGVNNIFHTFDPGKLISDNEDFTGIILDEKYALESGVYWSNQQRIGARLSLDYGIRYSIFNLFGPGDVYGYDEDNMITDTTTYAVGESIVDYGGFEPRLSIKYSLSESSSIKGSYNRLFQYLHLLSNSTSLMPTDIWVPSTESLKPQMVDQFAVGYFRNFANNVWELSIEGYYKNMYNQADFENGADILLNPKIESQILNGSGQSYGTEFLIKKAKGDFTGWLAYTLSRTTYTFDEINNGEPYLAKQDRTHDISLVGMYKLNDKWSLSATWVYQTGNAVTFPSGKYELDGQTISYYTERNGYRMPDYHRLDFGATWYRKKTENTESSWNFSIYNAYNRYNAYSISFNETDSGASEAVKLSIFGIVPSITYNFKF